ncbi:hypothetical protein [Hufsiella ginkgonis]|uniref:Uncharacterized protein n=1 Tax=Hufsiella ginkgonis TaxID=2695274 RepID=A0A7K1Y0Q7_9SPHI|nr:hypothetical protein [Hufsiella ginkgonis]MXV16864.1 hypothetical protein [Hufsiella ginkgonis]
MGTNFEIHHKVVDGNHILTFKPEIPNKGYPPTTIEVTEDQWNCLRYHFATGVNDKTGESILAYVI